MPYYMYMYTLSQVHFLFAYLHDIVYMYTCILCHILYSVTTVYNAHSFMPLPLQTQGGAEENGMQKKKREDFSFDKIIGEGSYSTVSDE